jgi:hypothetical protein
MSEGTAPDTTAAPGYPSPLWIIALFVALSETTAGVASITTDGTIALMFAIFTVVFPLLVLGVFVWLLLEHPGNLYSPWQYTAQTDVQSYSEALSRESRSRGAIFKLAISEALAAGVAAEQEEPDVAEQVLRAQVAARFEQVVKESCVTIDRSLLMDGAEPVQIPATPETTVDELLDSVWFSISSAVDPYTYNKSWVLADEDLQPLDEIGTQWAEHHDWQRDERSLDEAGIVPGATLLVLPRARPKRVVTSGRKRERRKELGDLLARVDRAARSEGHQVKRISGEQRPRRLVSDSKANYGLYAMPGKYAKASWVSLAADACRALASEQSIQIVPVLVLEREPSDQVRAEAEHLGVLVMWSDQVGLHDAPWAS